MVDFHTHQGLIYCSLIDFVHFSLLVAAVSVSVSGWTLVAISVERFYAICHPLVSKAYIVQQEHIERERDCACNTIHGSFWKKIIKDSQKCFYASNKKSKTQLARLCYILLSFYFSWCALGSILCVSYIKKHNTIKSFIFLLLSSL